MFEASTSPSSCIGIEDIVSVGKRTSYVWKYFGFIRDKSSGDVLMNKTACKLCLHSLPYCGNTTNMAFHVEKYHPKEHSIHEPPRRTARFQSNSDYDTTKRVAEVINAIKNEMDNEKDPITSLIGPGERKLVSYWGQRKSFVWHYFGFYENVQTKKLATKHAVCRLCGVVLRFYGTTTGMISHLSKEHPHTIPSHGTNESVKTPDSPSTLSNVQIHIKEEPVEGERNASRSNASASCDSVEFPSGTDSTANEQQVFGVISSIESSESFRSNSTDLMHKSANHLKERQMMGRQGKFWKPEIDQNLVYNFLSRLIVHSLVRLDERLLRMIGSNPLSAQDCLSKLHQQVLERTRSLLLHHRPECISLTVIAWWHRPHQLWIRVSVHFLSLDFRLFSINLSVQHAPEWFGVHHLADQLRLATALLPAKIVCVTYEAPPEFQTKLVEACKLLDWNHLRCMADTFDHCVAFAIQKHCLQLPISKLLEKEKLAYSSNWIELYDSLSTITNPPEWCQCLISILHPLKTTISLLLNQSNNAHASILPALRSQLLYKHFGDATSAEQENREEPWKDEKDQENSTNNVWTKNNNSVHNDGVDMESQGDCSVAGKEQADNGPSISDVKNIRSTIFLELKSELPDSRIFLLSSALDPRLKLLKFVSYDDRTHLELALQELCDKDGESEVEDASSAPSCKKNKIDIDFLMGDVVELKPDGSSSFKTQASRYRASPQLAVTQDPYEWWRSHASDLPLLANSARNYLSAQLLVERPQLRLTSRRVEEKMSILSIDECSLEARLLVYNNADMFS